MVNVGQRRMDMEQQEKGRTDKRTHPHNHEIFFYGSTL
jgi:hypothetical protein